MFFVVSIKFESFWSFLKLVLAKSGSNLDQSRRSLHYVCSESFVAANEWSYTILNVDHKAP